MSEGRQVVVLYGTSLIVAGLETSLRYSPGLEVVRINPALPEALRQMRSLRPNVIIFDGGDKALGDLPSAAQLLRDNPGAQIMRLDLDSNDVTILSSEQRSVTNSEEIAGVIRRAAVRNVSPSADQV